MLKQMLQVSQNNNISLILLSVTVQYSQKLKLFYNSNLKKIKYLILTSTKGKLLKMAKNGGLIQRR